jgi:hypothetical protein
LGLCVFLIVTLSSRIRTATFARREAARVSVGATKEAPAKEQPTSKGGRPARRTDAAITA